MILWGWRAYPVPPDEPSLELLDGAATKFVWMHCCWHAEKFALSASVPVPLGHLSVHSWVAKIICSVGLFAVSSGRGGGTRVTNAGTPTQPAMHFISLLQAVMHSDWLPADGLGDGVLWAAAKATRVRARRVLANFILTVFEKCSV